MPHVFPQLVTSKVQAALLAYTAASAALHSGLLAGDGVGGGALGGAPTSELLGDGEMPEQLRNASRQAASAQATQAGVVLSAAHSRRQLLTTQ